MKAMMVSVVAGLLAMSCPDLAFAGAARIVSRFSGCDYFIADGRRGLYIFEWYGGYDPDEGDLIVGDIDKYGFKDVYYPERGSGGRIYVEEYLESGSAALQIISDKCG